MLINDCCCIKIHRIALWSCKHELVSSKCSSSCHRHKKWGAVTAQKRQVTRKSGCFLVLIAAMPTAELMFSCSCRSCSSSFLFLFLLLLHLPLLLLTKGIWIWKAVCVRKLYVSKQAKSRDLENVSDFLWQTWRNLVTQNGNRQFFDNFAIVPSFLGLIQD